MLMSRRGLSTGIGIATRFNQNSVLCLKSIALSRPCRVLPLVLPPSPLHRKQFSTTNIQKFQSQKPLMRRYNGYPSGFGSRFPGGGFPGGFGMMPGGPRFPMLRLVFGVMLFTGLFIFVAAPLLFIVLPIVLICGVGFFRFKLRLSQFKMAKLLQRLESSSMRFTRRGDVSLMLLGESVVEDVKFQRFVNDRIKIFLEDNEQNNNLLQGPVNNVNLAREFDGMTQQWVFDQNGNENLVILLKTKLYDLDDIMLDVVVGLRLLEEELSEEGSEVYDVVIELIASRRNKFIIDTGADSWSDESDRIYNLKNYRVKNL